MKKIATLAASAVLATALILPASAAGNPIGVTVDGNVLHFSAGTPYSENGTTFVPFRAIFEKLGLQVSWDSKTKKVTGKKNGLSIELTVGSRTAKVNGVLKNLTLAPAVRGNTVYVPLRFISQTAGADVNWNADTSTVEIQTSEAKELAKNEIRALLDQMNKSLNEEDVAGYIALLDPDTVDDELKQSLQDYLDTYDTSFSIASIEFGYISGSEATVYTVEQSKRIGGDYAPDSEDSYEYSLVKKDGVWKINSVDMYAQTVLPPDLSQTVTVPSNEESAIKSVFEQNFKDINEKNLDGILSAIVLPEDSEELQDMKDFYQDYLNNYFIKSTLEKQQIIYYSKNKAAVYLESSTLEKEDSKTITIKTQSIQTLTKSSDGKWLIDEAYTISAEPTEE
ncbi:stalk domain-containing protein [Paenibacillus caui]|uniref:stalk domain-containing protein n=1 Tax=Paenibacillus caui TaxID=2873927 RepID=UPI001CA9C573|nr:stalk domain-containing protein [Paenibacillus caui]